MPSKRAVTLVRARKRDIEPGADERSGKSIVYDTVGAMGWRPDVTHHPIRTVITKVIEDEREWEDGRQVPVARREEDCFVR
jgi:putative lipase involved disintegration of autophagic bodies